LFLHIFPIEISGNHRLNIQIIGEGIDEIKKERQAVRSKIKVLEDELKLVDAEIASLQEDLDAATARKDKAYELLQELRAGRDAKVSLTYL
jgi:chromosome segregation ATPase